MATISQQILEAVEARAAAAGPRQIGRALRELDLGSDTLCRWRQGNPPLGRTLDALAEKLNLRVVSK